MFKIKYLIILFWFLVSSTAFAAGAPIATSIALPILELHQNHTITISHYSIECGSSKYFVDERGVVILVNGTPIELNRTCRENVLRFSPANNTENQTLLTLITESRNLNVRYKEGLRTYVYNDWQLAPIKSALKEE
ncbi:hypothetical protein [Vibrio sonorensis]|uniref:hypothetical protein n=1 Tax=Vibrio sonorensis TaxID=1004316 RepID=UPI0008DA2B4E|nr:hypothetical protein [Vibrio sonorensis]